MNRVESQKLQSVEEWEGVYRKEVFKGPYASLPVNNFCAEVYQQGLLVGSKFD